MIMNAISQIFPHTSRDEIAAQLAKLDARKVQFHRLTDSDDQRVNRVA